MTASKITSAIRNNLKDYDAWPNGILDGGSLKFFLSKISMSNEKVLDTDRNLRRKYLQSARTEPYTMPSYSAVPLPLTVMPRSFDQFFNTQINQTINELSRAKDNLEVNSASLPQFELLTERLEFFTQLYSAFKKLQNPQVWTVDDSKGHISIIIAGLFLNGIDADARNIIAGTLVSSL